jgi:hypothetical protein
VDLAHVPSFGLGRLPVLPALHQLVRDDDKTEILQHRVMQALIALARAGARPDRGGFAVAEAFYFGRGFVVPDVRFTREQGTYSPPGDRQTHFLFAPAAAAMRADRRFAALVADLGLDLYWRESGSRPDYQPG